MAEARAAARPPAPVPAAAARSTARTEAPTKSARLPGHNALPAERLADDARTIAWMKRGA